MLAYGRLCPAQDSSPNDSTTRASPPAFKAGPFISAALVTGAVSTWNNREAIRGLRNKYYAGFSNHFDDYLQYAPAAGVYSLQLGGIKGKNDLGRAALSHAASVGIMCILVNTAKYTARVPRPTGPARNSFPSGHTATAFTNAGFLHKEYGPSSYAYSIAGYSMAALTGAGRILNDRHWFCDVLAGAGIGILSTELGYLLVDRLYRNQRKDDGFISYVPPGHLPFSFSVKLGYAHATSNLLEGFGMEKLTAQRGMDIGAESIYYFNRHWGAYSDLSYASFLIQSLPEAGTQPVGMFNLSTGPYFTYAFNEQWQLYMKSGAGISLGIPGKMRWDTPDGPSLATFSPGHALNIQSGLSLSRKICNGLDLGVFFDYHYSNPRFTYTRKNFYNTPNERLVYSTTRRNRMDYMTSGLKLKAAIF